MNDQPTPTYQPATFDQAMLDRASPETKATFATLLAKNGARPEDIAAKLDPKTAPAPEIKFAPALSPEAALSAAVERAYAPPSSPNEYLIEIPGYAHAQDTAEIGKFMADLKSGFHSAAVPATMANSLAKTFFEAAEKWPGEEAGEDAQQVYLTTQQQRLKSLSTGTSADLRKFADIGQKALGPIGEELYSAGSFFTPEALMALAAFGRIVEARGKK